MMQQFLYRCSLSFLLKNISQISYLNFHSGLIKTQNSILTFCFACIGNLMVQVSRRVQLIMILLLMRTHFFLILLLDKPHQRLSGQLAAFKKELNTKLSFQIHALKT